MIYLAIAVAILVAALLVIAALRLLAPPRHRVWTTRLRLRIPDLPEPLHGLRIAFLSDLHEGMLYVTHEELLAAVERAAPDLLLLGGDYAATRRHRQPAINLVRRLAASRLTFGVPGNTEHYFHLDFDHLADAFAAGGGALLVNQTRRIDVGGAALEIIGLDDPGKGHTDIDAALAEASERADVRIAIVHSPAIWQELDRIGAHILLCGHTHGGQIRPPGLEAPMTHMSYPARLAAGLFRHSPEQRPVLQRVAGHWRILSRRDRPITASAAAGPLIYISRGVGVGILPFRFLCPPELVLMELLPLEPSRGARPSDE